MKINKIKFENIHSLKGKHEVDFSTGLLEDAGLYAITGATGAGKSTLLDVITLALFNQIPRVDGGMSSTKVDGEGHVMTRNTNSCFAEVEYTSKGKEYRSNWSINRNSKGTIQAHKHELADAETGEVIESSSSKVPKENETIIGLDYTQFVQAMVLSQGQFSKLLHSKRKDRNKLLEDITGAKIYRKIGLAVHDRLKEAKQAVKIQDASLTHIVFFEKEELLLKKNRIKELKAVEPAAKKKAEELKGQVLNKKKWNQLSADLEENTVASKKHLEAQEATKSSDKKLKRHVELSTYLPTLRSYETTFLEVKRIAAVKDKLILDKKEKETQQLDLLKKGSSLLGKPSSEKTVLLDLENYRLSISRLMEKERTKKSEAILHQQEFQKISEGIALRGGKLQAYLTPSEAKVSLKVMEEKVLSFIKDAEVEDLETLELEIINLDDKVKALTELKRLLGNYTIKKATTDKYQVKLDSGKKLIKEYKIKEVHLIKNTEALNLEVLKLDKALKKQIAHFSLEDHRKELEEGIACPLCGALDHPLSRGDAKPVVDEVRLEEKKKYAAQSSEFLIQVRANIKKQTADNVDLVAEIKQTTITLAPEKRTLDDQLKKMDFKDGIPEAELTAQITVFEKTSKIKQKAIKAFRIAEVIKAGQEKVEDWAKSLAAHREAERIRKELYLGNNVDADVGDLAKKITRTTSEIEGLNKQFASSKSDLDKAKINFEEKNTAVRVILKKESLFDISALKVNILNDSQVIEIQKLLEDLLITSVKLEEAKKRIDQELKLLKQKKVDGFNLEDLQTQSTAAIKTWEALFGEQKEIETELKADTDSRLKQEKEVLKLVGMQQEEALWKSMDGMIGGGYGEKFSNFVQDLTMEQLIHFTNKRLGDLNDRYVLEVPSAKSANDNDSLKIFDAYMGNEVRAVKTLSGGETFMVSLAMAFALSDLAAKNIKIESIFIDEGFGTLDPETLDQAISILEKMQSEDDKSIGVISHVEALKERISTQIKLEKSGAGYSSITIE
jgi:exonuclease SbcC